MQRGHTFMATRDCCCRSLVQWGPTELRDLAEEDALPVELLLRTVRELQLRRLAVIAPVQGHLVGSCVSAGAGSRGGARLITPCI